MLRGEFIRSDGVVVPNNIMTHGARMILNAAFANIDAAFWVGLVDAVPSPTLQVEDLTEPTIGVNGYARQEIQRSSVGWPTVGEVNGGRYIESSYVTFTASGGAFDQPIRRLALFPSETATTGDLFCLSAPFPEYLTVDESTPEADRKFRYRVYLR